MLSIPHLPFGVRRQRYTEADTDADVLCDEASTATALVPRRALHPRHDSDAAATASTAMTVATVSDAAAATTSLTTALATLPRRRRARRRSKNCRTLSQFGVEYAGFRRGGGAREQRMADALLAVQQQVLVLESRRSLLHSLELARHANAQQIAADKIREYYTHFRRGYDPSACSPRARTLETLLRSVLAEDVSSPAFADIDAFLHQWANYSRYHADVVVSIQSIEPLETDDLDFVVVKCAGMTTFRISRDTIEHFFQPILHDETLVQQLIGKEYCFPFVTLFHFNMQGRVARMEPRADLAAGLFNLVTDPFSTVKLLRASQLTTEGCLHAYPARDGKPARTA